MFLTLCVVGISTKLFSNLTILDKPFKVVKPLLKWLLTLIEESVKNPNFGRISIKSFVKLQAPATKFFGKKLSLLRNVSYSVKTLSILALERSVIFLPGT